MVFNVIVQHLAACSFNPCCSHLSHILLGKVGLGAWWNAGIYCLSCNEKMNILYSQLTLADLSVSLCSIVTYWIAMWQPRQRKNCIIQIKTAELTYLVAGGFVDEHSTFWWLFRKVSAIILPPQGSSDRLWVSVHSLRAGYWQAVYRCSMTKTSMCCGR